MEKYESCNLEKFDKLEFLKTTELKEIDKLWFEVIKYNHVYKCQINNCITMNQILEYLFKTKSLEIKEIRFFYEHPRCILIGRNIKEESLISVIKYCEEMPFGVKGDILYGRPLISFLYNNNEVFLYNKSFYCKDEKDLHDFLENIMYSFYSNILKLYFIGMYNDYIIFKLPHGKISNFEQEYFFSAYKFNGIYINYKEYETDHIDTPFYRETKFSEPTQSKLINELKRELDNKKL